jgi:hypothetical protein
MITSTAERLKHCSIAAVNGSHIPIGALETLTLRMKTLETNPPLVILGSGMCKFWADYLLMPNLFGDNKILRQRVSNLKESLFI